MAAKVDLNEARKTERELYRHLSLDGWFVLVASVSSGLKWGLANPWCGGAGATTMIFQANQDDWAACKILLWHVTSKSTASPTASPAALLGAAAASRWAGVVTCCTASSK
jgi:hypothetical protein